MQIASTSKFPELGFYGLPGHTRTPRDVLQQVRDAEELGVGNVMLSERSDYKEISAICGACAAVTENLCIGTSATNLNTRHPVVTASMGSTLHALSEGRFALGLAKGVRWVDQFEAGADGIIIHASTPEEFAPVLAEYEKIRPNALFEGRTNRPV